MIFTRAGIGDKAFELGKSVLLLSALAIGAKAWNVDLSNVKVFDITVSKYGAEVLLGMLGLVLWITLSAYFVARVEVTLDSQLSEDTRQSIDGLVKRKGLMALAIVAMPLALLIYIAPYVLGVVAAWVVRRETIAALYFIFHHV